MIEYVYFISGGPENLIKIGYTSNNPNFRFASIQAGCPVALTKIGVIKGDANREKELHAQFAHLRKHYEWFRPGKDLLEFITLNAKCWPKPRVKQVSQIYIERNYKKRLELKEEGKLERFGQNHTISNPVNGVYVRRTLKEWSEMTGVSLKLVCESYRGAQKGFKYDPEVWAAIDEAAEFERQTELEMADRQSALLLAANYVGE